MKKSIKKLSAIALAAAMSVTAASMAVTTAFAADPTTYTLTVASGDVATRTYDVYQIFTGKLLDNGSLVDIAWGSGITAEGKTTLGDAETFAKTLTEANIKTQAKTIAKYLSTTKQTVGNDAGAESADVASLTGLAPGYYLVKDVSTLADGDTKSNYILKVVKNETITSKKDVPTSDKTVTDVNDSNGTSEAGQKDADYDINDNVPYELTFKLPTDYADYEKYPVTFYDDMCAGLTYNGDAKIYNGTTEIGDIEFVSTTDRASTNGGTVYKASIADLKVAPYNTLGAGDTVTIKYTAKLNENAVIGNAGNKNTYSVEFANDPTWTATPDDGDTTNDTPPSSETPKVTNVVFTYKVVINKIDAETNPLPGANFALYKWIPDTEGTEEYNGVKGAWTAAGLANTGTAATAPTTFEFKGVDDGIYKLVETATPEGYNPINPIIFTIAPATNGDLNDVTLPEVTFVANDAAGSLTADVINEEGIVLPGTGGIGTTVFYVIGVMIIAGATTLLISKKRMKNINK